MILLWKRKPAYLLDWLILQLLHHLPRCSIIQVNFALNWDNEITTIRCPCQTTQCARGGKIVCLWQEVPRHDNRGIHKIPHSYTAVTRWWCQIFPWWSWNMMMVIYIIDYHNSLIPNNSKSIAKNTGKNNALKSFTGHISNSISTKGNLAASSMSFFYSKGDWFLVRSFLNIKITAYLCIVLHTIIPLTHVPKCILQLHLTLPMLPLLPPYSYALRRFL